MKKLSLIVLAVSSLTVLFSCKKESTTVNNGGDTVSNPIKSDTICGNVKGTMLAGKTYYVNCDVTVLSTDTLIIQSGVTVRVLNNATFFISGVIMSEGTEASPITFSGPSDDSPAGSWGGFQCDTANYVSFVWTHIIATGGPDETGSPRKTIKLAKNSPFIMQDSWIYGGEDDGLRLQGAQISILRNTIQAIGTTDGEAINIKDGCVGDIAYNYIWSIAGSGIKVETSDAVFFPQTSVNIYNNTVVNSGFRRGAGEPGRAILMDLFAKGNIYNNILVNTYWGLEITPLVDTVNVHYGNNLFYSTVDSIRQFYYPAGSWGKPQPTDLISTGLGVEDPKFKFLDTNVNNTTDLNDPHLQTGSPAIGSGNTTYNKDLGAFPTDGTGNKH